MSTWASLGKHQIQNLLLNNDNARLKVQNLSMGVIANLSKDNNLAMVIKKMKQFFEWALGHHGSFHFTPLSNSFIKSLRIPCFIFLFVLWKKKDCFVSVPKRLHSIKLRISFQTYHHILLFFCRLLATGSPQATILSRNSWRSWRNSWFFIRARWSEFLSHFAGWLANRNWTDIWWVTEKREGWNIYGVFFIKIDESEYKTRHSYQGLGQNLTVFSFPDTFLHTAFLFL